MALLHDVLRLLERFAVESALVETSQCEKHGQRYSDSMYGMVGMVCCGVVWSGML